MLGAEIGGVVIDGFFESDLTKVSMCGKWWCSDRGVLCVITLSKLSHSAVYT